MENAGFIVHNDPVIVEDLVQSKEQEAAKDANQETEATQNKKNLFCCCVTNASENKTSEATSQSSAKDADSPPSVRGCAAEARAFLSSPVYYIFVIVVTFSIFLILLVELFVDTGNFHVGNEENSQEEAKKISLALHWFSFAILVGFFIEIIFRLILWKMALARDCISVFDSFVVLIAFISNLCATLIAGPESPYDSICLIIILRLLRIHSLIKVKVDLSTRQYKYRTKKAEEDLVTANYKITALNRRIEEKDYEIRQLQAHLGSEPPNDRQLMKALQKSMAENDSKGATADADLEMAIALSKQSFEDRFGVVNEAFSLTHVEEEKDMTVLVHHRPIRKDSEEFDAQEAPRVTSYIDEYFSRPNNSNGSSSVNPNTGAIPKKSTMNLPIKANLNSNNNSQAMNSLQVLQIDEPSIEPISVCIDPSILTCESPVSNEVHPTVIEQVSSTQTTSNEARPTVSSSPSDVGSSDDCPHDTSPDNEVTPENKAMKFWQKKNGSSVSSESGYLSEDSNGKRKLTLPAMNSLHGTEIESSAL